MESNKSEYNVAITGAAGQVGSYLITLIASGHMLGPNTKINLQLIELPHAMEVLNGVMEEIKDLASPVIGTMFGTSDSKVGFKDADIILLVGAFPRGPNMTRGDLISKNANIFKTQGEILHEVAKPDVKICVVGNPTNVNATI